MKNKLPPQDDYVKFMNNELVGIATKERLNWKDITTILIDKVGFQRWKNHDNAYLVIPDKEYVKPWVKMNVGGVGNVDRGNKRMNVKGSLSFNFFGYSLTTREISEITGLAITTVYKYWQRSEHDVEVFEALLSKKMTEEQIRVYLAGTNSVQLKTIDEEQGDDEYDC